ncbi:MAG: helix-turn-helix domain-containing protein [Candidatus Pacearchaeota archaeon]|jgi:DNA-binding MarR family transcriptional regulator
MKIVKTDKGKSYVLKTKEIPFTNLPSMNELSINILKVLKEHEMYPKQIAKKLKVHEQNVYYYIHQLEKSGIIKVSKQENINGTVAKFYTLTSDSFYFKLHDFRESSKLEEKEPEFLSPFIDKGELNALIIVGSPDPHGPQKARSRDGYFGMDLALFLGTFLNYVGNSKVMLDTEVHDSDLEENNLIILGGPIVNKVTETINKKMPIYFDEEKKGFFSTISDKVYFHDEIGVINKCKSPFNKDKMVLTIAGLRNSGTKSAIIAFLKKFEELSKGNIYDKKVFSKVVEGEDLDSDGIVDSVEILE